MKGEPLPVPALLLLLVTVAGAQQQPAKTIVHGHELGESWNRFAAEVGYPGDAGCVEWYKGKQAQILGDSHLAESEAKFMICPYYRQAATGSGTRVEVELPLDDRHTSPFFADFSSGKMISMSTLFEANQFETVRDQLVERYGQPASSGVKTVQNNFGAHWDLRWIKWLMPDGAVIDEEEAIHETAGHVVEVHFIAGEYIKALESAPPTKNPF
jgi:hypothetical protein